jgi:CheY-like chemotaxis protein
VVTADGHEAPAAMEREPFDVVLMDVHMPSMGGFEPRRPFASASVKRRLRPSASLQ